MIQNTYSHVFNGIPQESEVASLVFIKMMKAIAIHALHKIGVVLALVSLPKPPSISSSSSFVKIDEAIYFYTEQQNKRLANVIISLGMLKIRPPNTPSASPMS